MDADKFFCLLDKYVVAVFETCSLIDKGMPYREAQEKHDIAVIELHNAMQHIQFKVDCSEDI